MLRNDMDAFSALADPVRSQIVRLLAASDFTASGIAAEFPVSRPAISRHLSVLLKARLVQVRSESQRRIYSLDPRGLDEIDSWVAEQRAVWNRRFEVLGAHLDAMAKIAADDHEREQTR
jgi:DNA-binding transcriptional ArsR family regulator